MGTLRDRGEFLRRSGYRGTFANYDPAEKTSVRFTSWCHGLCCHARFQRGIGMMVLRLGESFRVEKLNKFENGVRLNSLIAIN